MLIRPEQFGDEAAIHAVYSACFLTDAEARLVDSLRDSGRLTLSLVAEVDGVIVGHIAFSPVTVAAGPPGLGLAPVAVIETHRKRGIAAGLIRDGLDRCRLLGFSWAVVLGDPAYYSRFGFRPATEFGLSDEYSGGPAFQALELIPGGRPVGAGLVRYSPEFQEFV